MRSSAGESREELLREDSSLLRETLTGILQMESSHELLRARDSWQGDCSGGLLVGTPQKGFPEGLSRELPTSKESPEWFVRTPQRDPSEGLLRGDWNAVSERFCGRS